MTNTPHFRSYMQVLRELSQGDVCPSVMLVISTIIIGKYVEMRENESREACPDTRELLQILTKSSSDVIGTITKITEDNKRLKEALAALGNGSLETDSPLEAQSVNDLDLSVRSRNCLTKMGISTISELLRSTEQEIVSHKKFGQTFLREVKKSLAARGLRLGMYHEGENADSNEDDKSNSGASDVNEWLDCDDEKADEYWEAILECGFKELCIVAGINNIYLCRHYFGKQIECCQCNREIFAHEIVFKRMGSKCEGKSLKNLEMKQNYYFHEACLRQYLHDMKE